MRAARWKARKIERDKLLGNMLPEVESALRLNEIDNRTVALNKEIAALPKHVAEIEKRLESHKRRLEADQAALQANQKDRKRFEGDIQLAEQKISKLRDQMLQAKTNEQYRAFQNEISFCESEIRKAEDKILDLMAASEPLEKNVKAAEVSLKEEQAEVNEEKKKAEERTAADKKELDEKLAQRKEFAESLSSNTLRLYDRARKLRGIGITEMVDGRCSNCNITIRLALIQEMHAEKKIMTCESCGVILYENPVKTAENFRGEAPPMVIRRM